MNRRELLTIIILSISMVTAYLVSDPARGEIMVTIGGDIENTTKVASDRFNVGLSEFHLMMAALDRSPDDAAAHRKQAVDALLDAASRYENASRDAQTRELAPQPETSQDQAAVGYFWQHVAEFHGAAPYTQRSLLTLTSNLVGSFAAVLERQDLKKLAADRRSQLALFDMSVRLQAFLVSTTIMVRLG
jgi:hypothetical protein